MSKPSGNRPNIVLVMTDQQRYDTIAALGFPYMKTPHLDRMVREGVNFRNTFVTSPSCSPSRASIFTGLYPHAHQVLRNDAVWRWTWVHNLADAGYRCVNVGKMHTHPFEKSFGFHERHVVENKDRAHPSLPFFMDNWDKALWTRGFEKPSRVTYRRRADYRECLGAFTWELPPDLHSDNFVGDLATHWLDAYPNKPDEPFFLQIGIPGPHPPYDPTPDALALYADADLPEPIVDQQDLEGQPQALKDLRRDHLDQDHDAIVHLANPSPAQTRRQRQHYYANMSMIDAQMGKLIDALERRGVLDNTVIIFTTDHGDCLGDHGHSQKWSMFEQSVHVPFIVWGPGLGIQPIDSDALASLMDVGPTVLELAGLDVPHWMQATSLMPVVRGERKDLRPYVVSEHYRDLILRSTERMTMIRDQRWKLVEFYDSTDGQLFDLAQDPGELRNRWNDPDCVDKQKELTLELAHWRTENAGHADMWRSATAEFDLPSAR